MQGMANLMLVDLLVPNEKHLLQDGRQLYVEALKQLHTVFHLEQTAHGDVRRMTAKDDHSQTNPGGATNGAKVQLSHSVSHVHLRHSLRLEEMVVQLSQGQVVNVMPGCKSCVDPTVPPELLHNSFLWHRGREGKQKHTQCTNTITRQARSTDNNTQDHVCMTF